MKAISVPFRFTSDTKAVATTNDVRHIVEQSIIDILTTGAGERVMNAKYGAGLRNLLFEEMDPLVFAEYKIDAIQDLNEYLTMGKVVDMNIRMPDQTLYTENTDTTIIVSVKYVVPPYGSSVVTFNLGNAQNTLLGGTF